ncbi:MAG TPA: glycerol-3-phosphate 1-O-acyltransferase PlsY [Usitatibacter sp.]|nr:glycerol-3-phosphate 1-O-acyltransferase PlsY [Usitatibacter sp.]
MTAFLCALAGYLAGSIPFALVVSRALRLPDPRTYGSGNIGATNVLRSGSRRAALFTLLGDAAKGWAAVLVASALGLAVPFLALVGFAAFLGHLFPVWLRFHGGKGVATAAGVLIAFDWRLGVAAIGIWLAVAAATRYSSLGALLAAVAAPAAAWWMFGADPRFYAVLGMAVLLVLRHRGNIVKLARGEESRIGEKKAAQPAPAGMDRMGPP